MATTPTLSHFSFKLRPLTAYLMIHLSTPEKGYFFWRELISKASDALDKLRFEGLTNCELVPNDHTMRFAFDPDIRRGL